MHKTGISWAMARFSRHFLVVAACLAMLIAIMTWHLAAVPFSASETASLASAKSLHQLAHNPINAPHQVLEYGLQHIHHAGRYTTRLVSVLYYVTFLGCFYYISRSWFGKFSARLAVLLLGFTPLLILVGRSATSDIMLLFPLVVIGAYMWFVRSRTKLELKLLLLSAAAALCLYEPGGLLFLLVGLLYANPSLRQTAKVFSNKIVLLSSLVFLVLAAPLIAALVKQPALIKQLALIPAQLPTAIDFLKWVGWDSSALVWHSGLHNYLQLGRTAILDVSQIVFVGFGLYALGTRAIDKTYTLGAVVVFAILEASFNQAYNLLIICLPALMVLATAGLRYLHIEWNSVFPRNPLPRGLALILLLSVVGLHVFWGVHYSLTAWPHSFGLFR